LSIVSTFPHWPKLHHWSLKTKVSSRQKLQHLFSGTLYQQKQAKEYAVPLEFFQKGRVLSILNDKEENFLKSKNNVMIKIVECFNLSTVASCH
jgi:hypothetical protein